MSLPVLITSDMMGSPNLTPTNGSLNALLNACLVNGFNTQSVVTATCASGVVTFNFASAPGFSALDTVTIAGASNGTVNGQKRVQIASGNQVLVAIPGVPDGAVGGTITLKFSPLGWTRPYSGTNLGAYRQGGAATHKRFLRVYDGTLGTAWLYYVRGYENMTAISTGTGPFPTTAQVSGNGLDQFGAHDSTGDLPAQQARAWVIVGTPRYFYLFNEYGRVMYGSSDSKNPVASVALPTLRGFRFGEYANVAKTADTYAYGIVDYTGASAYAPRSVAGTGTAISVGERGLANALFAFGAGYPSGSDNGIHFNGAPMALDNTSPYNLRGTVPGGLLPIESPYDQGAPAPAFAHTLTSVPGVTGRVMLLGHAGNWGNTLGVLLDEDWGDL